VLYAIVAGFLAGVNGARAATIEYQFFPDQTNPTAQGWTEDGIDANDAVNIIPDSHLELVNGSRAGDNGVWFIRTGAADIPGEEEDWQMRSRFRIDSHTGTQDGLHTVAQVGDDAQRLIVVTAGLVDDANSSDEPRGNDTHVILRGNNSTTSDQIVTIATGRPWLEVVMSKTSGPNTASSADDDVTVTVSDLNGTQLGCLTRTVADTDRADASRLLFGNIASYSAGSVELTGTTFGINENAPAILPEPTGLTLLSAAGLLVLWGRRRD
jgi:hypothetical protein